MDPAMYIFLNRGAGMSTGKAAAQAAHAAVEAFRIDYHVHRVGRPNLHQEWLRGGHYKKLVMEARNSQHLLVIDRYLRDRGFQTALIIDEGLTEIEAHTPTALGVEIVDKDDPHTAATFSTFKLYRDPKPSTAVERFTQRFGR